MMLRRVAIIAIVLALVGVGIASAEDVVTVPSDRWTGASAQLQLWDNDMGWGGDNAVTLSWNITKSAGGIYSYTYTWSDPVTQWVLEASPNKTNVSFAWGSGYTATLSWPSSTTRTKVGGGSATLANAITFIPSGGSGTSFSFQTYLNPVYGDVWGKNALAGLANNPKVGVGVDASWTSAVLAANYVPMPDSAYGGGDIVIPEPGMSVLALGALVAGAFARWRRRKED